MLKYLRKRKGQSSVEYAILIIVVIGALLSIQVYVKRGIQGRLKSATDDIGDQFSLGNTNVTHTMITESLTKDTFEFGKSKSTLLATENSIEDYSSNIMNVQSEFWGKAG